MRSKHLNLENVLMSLVGFKFFYLLCRVFAPFSLPHVFRQTDTMSVSLRYYSRWFLESEQHLLWAPAVLTSGDKYGLVGMEFPFLNIFTAWPFVFDIYWARGFAFAMYLLVASGLTLYTYHKWKNIEWQGIPLKLGVLIYCLVGISSTYVGKFMPDYLAFSFVMLSIPYFIQNKYFKFGGLFVLGCLIKPTAIAALSVLFLLVPLGALIKRSYWIIAGIVIVLIWYKGVVPYIIRQSDVEQLFYIQLASPFASLLESLKNTSELSSLLFKRVLPLFILVLGWVYCFIGKHKKALRSIFLVMVLNLMFIFMLAGPTTYVHEYYHMGLSFLSSLVFLCLLRENKILCSLLMLIVGVRLIQDGVHELKHYGDKRNHYAECEQILTDFPEIQKDLKIQSSKEPFPKTGLCLGKVQNSINANYGVFYTNDTTPERCVQLKSYTLFKVAKCGSPQ